MPPSVNAGGSDRADPEAASLTTSGAAPTGLDSPARPIDLTLARTHLRLGALALARTELEILAGRGQLDLPGRVDLAEVRWRLGDLAGAGEAATAAFGSGEDDPVALAIAAESAAAAGRPNEARRLATQAMQRTTRPIDELFAGMPRSAVWPGDAAHPPPVATTLFDHVPAPRPHIRAGDTDPSVVNARTRHVTDERTAAPRDGAATVGFWDAESPDVTLASNRDPETELAAARAAAQAGAIDDAAVRLALLLRLAPALAPAVLDATGGMTGPAISLIRGDAFRLIGLEAEAQRAYAAVAWSGSRDRRRERAAPDEPVEHGEESVEVPTNGS